MENDCLFTISWLWMMRLNPTSNRIQYKLVKTKERNDWTCGLNPDQIWAQIGLKSPNTSWKIWSAFTFDFHWTFWFFAAACYNIYLLLCVCVIFFSPFKFEYLLFKTEMRPPIRTWQYIVTNEYESKPKTSKLALNVENFDSELQKTSPMGSPL